MKKKRKRSQSIAAATPTAVLEILTDHQAATYLGIGRRTLRLWRRIRQLPHIKITNREIRYRKSDLDQWLDRHRVAIAA